MEKLELEKLLETGFYALGVEFSRRKYGEEIRASASVDDYLGKKSIADAERQNASYNNPYGALLGALNLFGNSREDLTDDQKYVWDRSVPFFIRNAKPAYEIFDMDYTVHATKDRNVFEPHADEIIADREIMCEHIDIDLATPQGNIGLAKIDVFFDDYPKQVENPHATIYHTAEELKGIIKSPKENEFEKQKLIEMLDRKLKALKNSVEKPYDANIIYKALMDFFSPEER